MIKSMTGYGKGEAADLQGRCLVEIKTVNNRYGEVSVKMPRSFLAYEHEVRKAVGMSGQAWQGRPVCTVGACCR
jgi:uncharacterized protein (TIGR00255 family)